MKRQSEADRDYLRVLQGRDTPGEWATVLLPVFALAAFVLIFKS